jgi:hypothetical protein
MAELDERSQRILATMNEAVERDYKTWDDLYQHLDRAYEQWRDCKCPACTVQLALTYRSFHKAMEMNPEEGDVVEIAKEMNKYVLLTCKENNIIYSESGEDLAEQVKKEVLPLLIDEEDLSPSRKIH